jgi:hypothetical protein
MFECLCCGSDKFHLNEEGARQFLSCSHCGIQSDIKIEDICQLVTATNHSSSGSRTATRQEEGCQYHCKYIKQMSKKQWKENTTWDSCDGCRFKKDCTLPYLPPCGIGQDFELRAEHDQQVAQRERDRIYKRLAALATDFRHISKVHHQIVEWSDIDCLFMELVKECRQQQGGAGGA